ncbi:hypothetical protein [Peribacillus tepidiphilus]|uniref:hypothetical protein n=1 Tax=Peribacillus tepidiphilus TaxID=2652445 RepID=UPI0035B53A09
MVKISVHLALLIESVRANGIDQEEMLHLLEKRDYSRFQEVLEGLSDWEELGEFYHNDPSTCKRAILEGYQVKFLTKGGLKSFLKVKYHLEAGKDFEEAESALHGIHLLSADLETLRSALSINWTIVEEDFDEEKAVHVIRIEQTYKNQGV